MDTFHGSVKQENTQKNNHKQIAVNFLIVGLHSLQDVEGSLVSELFDHQGHHQVQHPL